MTTTAPRGRHAASGRHQKRGGTLARAVDTAREIASHTEYGACDHPHPCPPGQHAKEPQP